MNGWIIEVTNPYTGHYGVIEYVYGVPFLHFCSKDRAACETFLAQVDIK